MLPQCNTCPRSCGNTYWFAQLTPHHKLVVCCAKLELSPLGFASATHVFIIPHALVIIKVDALPTATCVSGAYADKACMDIVSVTGTMEHGLDSRGAEHVNSVLARESCVAVSGPQQCGHWLKQGEVTNSRQHICLRSGRPLTVHPLNMCSLREHRAPGHPPS